MEAAAPEEDVWRDRRTEKTEKSTEEKIVEAMSPPAKKSKPNVSIEPADEVAEETRGEIAEPAPPLEEKNAKEDKTVIPGSDVGQGEVSYLVQHEILPFRMWNYFNRINGHLN